MRARETARDALPPADVVAQEARVEEVHEERDLRHLRHLPRRLRGGRPFEDPAVPPRLPHEVHRRLAHEEPPRLSSVQAQGVRDWRKAPDAEAAIS